jgi:hypothetical protein
LGEIISGELVPARVVDHSKRLRWNLADRLDAVSSEAARSSDVPRFFDQLLRDERAK